MISCYARFYTDINGEGAGEFRAEVSFGEKHLEAFQAQPENKNYSICTTLHSYMNTFADFEQIKESDGGVTCVLNYKFSNLKELEEIYSKFKVITINELKMENQILIHDVEIFLNIKSMGKPEPNFSWYVTYPGYFWSHNADSYDKGELFWSLDRGIKQELTAKGFVSTQLPSLILNAREVSISFDEENAGEFIAVVQYDRDSFQDLKDLTNIENDKICEGLNYYLLADTHFEEIEVEDGDLGCLITYPFPGHYWLPGYFEKIEYVKVKKIDLVTNDFLFNMEVDLRNLDPDTLSTQKWSVFYPGVIYDHNGDRYQGGELIWELTPGEKYELLAEGMDSSTIFILILFCSFLLMVFHGIFLIVGSLVQKSKAKDLPIEEKYSKYPIFLWVRWTILSGAGISMVLFLLTLSSLLLFSLFDQSIPIKDWIALFVGVCILVFVQWTYFKRSQKLKVWLWITLNVLGVILAAFFGSVLMEFLSPFFNNTYPSSSGFFLFLSAVFIGLLDGSFLSLPSAVYVVFFHRKDPELSKGPSDKAEENE
jgi:hypothetical protein